MQILVITLIFPSKKCPETLHIPKEKLIESLEGKWELLILAQGCSAHRAMSLCSIRLDHHYVIAVRAAAAFAAVTLVATLIAASSPAAPRHEGTMHGSSEYEGWRDATRVTYAYNTTKAAFFAWRQPIYETASNSYLPASCKCTLSSELTNGAQLPMLPDPRLTAVIGRGSSQ